MALEISKEARTLAVTSLLKFFDENMDEPIGNLAAAELIDFFVEEIGPTIYNQGVSDGQSKMQQAIIDLDQEVHADPFLYWVRRSSRKK